MQFTLFIFLLMTSSLQAQDNTPTNKHFWYSMETTAPSDTIWRIWTDVSNWKDWDTGLKDASLESEFVPEAKGLIISLEGRKSKFKVLEVKEKESYLYKTRLPLGSLFIRRYLSTENGVTTFTHEVWFSGLTGGLFAKAFGEKFRNMLPEVLQNIKNIAEDGITD